MLKKNIENKCPLCEKNGILKKILLSDKYYLKIFNVNKINQLN